MPFYLYLILRTRMIVVKMEVMIFAIMIGTSCFSIPYKSQRIIPVVNTRYIPNDRSFVCLDLMVLIAWGKNETVVKAAATNPIIEIQLIIFR